MRAARRIKINRLGVGEETDYVCDARLGYTGLGEVGFTWVCGSMLMGSIISQLGLQGNMLNLDIL